MMTKLFVSRLVARLSGRSSSRVFTSVIGHAVSSSGNQVGPVHHNA